jgi:hypothetical protein
MKVAHVRVASRGEVGQDVTYIWCTPQASG